jgi:hypothetical protein
MVLSSQLERVCSLPMYSVSRPTPSALRDVTAPESVEYLINNVKYTPYPFPPSPSTFAFWPPCQFDRSTFTMVRSRRGFASVTNASENQASSISSEFCLGNQFRLVRHCKSNGQLEHSTKGGHSIFSYTPFNYHSLGNLRVQSQ